MNESGMRGTRWVSVTQMRSHFPDKADSFNEFNLEGIPLILRETILRIVDRVNLGTLGTKTSREEGSFPG